jgi:hypothetical protein
VTAAIVQSGSIGEALRRLEANKLRVAPIGERVLKALVGAGTVPGWLAGDHDVLRQGFYASLASESAFFAMLPSMTKVPFRAHIAASTSTLVAPAVGEGQPVPVNAMTIARPMLDPTKVSLICYMTRELAESIESAALIRAEMTSAAARGVDKAFVAELVASGIASTAATAGGTEASIKADLATMLGTVVTSSAARLYWVAGIDTAATLSLATTGWQGSSVSPSGGTLLGIPFLVSDGVAPDSLLLVDAASILANSGPLDLQVSGQADLVPNTTPTVPAAVVSMFQSNSVATKVVLSFAAEPLRTTAAYLLTGVGA